MSSGMNDMSYDVCFYENPRILLEKNSIFVVEHAKTTSKPLFAHSLDRKCPLLSTQLINSQCISILWSLWPQLICLIDMTLLKYLSTKPVSRQLTFPNLWNSFFICRLIVESKIRICIRIEWELPIINAWKSLTE